MDEQNVIYLYNGKPATERNKLLVHGTKQKNLRNIILSEKSETQKTTYFMIPFNVEPKKDKFTETESRSVLSGAAWGVRISRPDL